MEDLFIRYGQEKRYFKAPPDWNVRTFAAFQDHYEQKDPALLTRHALNHPIRSAPLKEHVSSSNTVAILIEDQTRYSPKKFILRTLLEVLDEAGVPPENVCVVLALGTHRGLSREEMEEVYGKETVNDFEFINHDCYAPDLVPVATLKTGTPVKINRRVYDASFKIGIGSIFPHPMNGFGGGGKILFPGVANFEAILEHHLRYAFRDESELGKIQGNPFYEEISTLAKAGGLDFIINSVLDHNDQLYDLVCGDPIEAHRVGIERCRGIISQRFQKKADLTIISAFPYTEGTQLMKPFAPATLITKKGGGIILVARCTVPLPDIYVDTCEQFRLRYKHRLRDGVFDFLNNNRRIMENGAPELNMSLAQALLAQDAFTVIFVSEEIPKEIITRLGFLFAKELDEALKMAAALFPRPDVHVVPSGGVILPVMQENDEPSI